MSLPVPKKRTEKKLMQVPNYMPDVLMIKININYLYCFWFPSQYFLLKTMYFVHFEQRDCLFIVNSNIRGETFFNVTS